MSVFAGAHETRTSGLSWRLRAVARTVGQSAIVEDVVRRLGAPPRVWGVLSLPHCRPPRPAVSPSDRRGQSEQGDVGAVELQSFYGWRRPIGPGVERRSETHWATRRPGGPMPTGTRSPWPRWSAPLRVPTADQVEEQPAAPAHDSSGFDTTGNDRSGRRSAATDCRQGRGPALCRNVGLRCVERPRMSRGARLVRWSSQ